MQATYKEHRMTNEPNRMRFDDIRVTDLATLHNGMVAVATVTATCLQTKLDGSMLATPITLLLLEGDAGTLNGADDPDPRLLNAATLADITQHAATGRVLQAVERAWEIKAEIEAAERGDTVGN